MPPKTPPHVIDLIEKAYRQKAEFLDLGNCGLTAIPPEIKILSPFLKELNFGAYYMRDVKYIKSNNNFSQNNFSKEPNTLQYLSELPSIKSLYVFRCLIGDTGAQHISQLTHLTSLNLSDNQIGEKGAQYISQLTQLTSLNLSDNQIGEKGAQYISQLPALTSLNLSDNQIGEKGAQHISQLPALTSLDLSYNQIGDEGVQHISQLPALTSLDLSSNQIGDEGVQHISQLPALTSLDLSYNQIGDEGVQHISQLTQLTSLDLSYNQIGDEGVQHISQLPALTSLDLSSNQIGDEGVQHISQLPSLTSLDLRINQIGEKGAQYISQLPALTSLDLSYNQIGEKGAQHISQLPALTSLDLSYNQIGEKGAQHISQLPALTSLNLSDNQIGEKGAQHISQLPALTSLDLSYNQIGDEGVQHISQLPALTSLDLSSNQIGDTGAQHISQLPALTSLDLRINQIGEKGAQYISQLPALTSLDLSSNQIGDTGAQHISQLPALTSLDLRSNQIGDTGVQHISQLTQLTSLDLSYNQIGDEGVQHISQLPALTSLDLSSNQIGDEGVQHISQLPALTSLDLRINQIGEKGAQYISQLPALTSLDLSSNQIGDEGAQYISQLPALTSLDLRSNQIGETGAQYISQLTQLTSLYLSDNQIGDKGAQHISQLTQLTSLKLSNNQIGNTGARFLANLKKINTLFVQNNFISNIPVELFLNIRSNVYTISSPEFLIDSGIYLGGNPIQNVPPEILNQGRDEIIDYLLKKEKEGTENIYEAKITLVGEGGAGKTSLQRRLNDLNATLPEGDKHTRGIEVVDWIVDNDKQQKRVAHIWDFGGQDVYFPVHRFFLTENSVFVLMATTRNQFHNFDYWIPTIYQFGGKSPIILVQNCHDGRKENWTDIDHLLSRDDFTIIRDARLPYFQVNFLNNNQGLEDLKHSIKRELYALENFGKEILKSWAQLRLLLYEKSKTDDCLTFDKFTEFCKNANPVAFESIQSVESFTQYMHDIGVLLWYRKNPYLKEWVILNPTWATNAVYAIIDDDKVQKQNGVIYNDDFERIWCEYNYQYRQQVLKKMLEVFKISFPKKHAPDIYLLPALHDTLPKDKKWKEDKDSLRYWFIFNFPVKGLINQLSAELSNLIKDDEVWKDAVNFLNEKHNVSCQVTEDVISRKIYIHGKGKNAQLICYFIQESLRNLIAQYKGVSYEIKVPCRCNDCIANPESATVFPYEKLLKWSEEPGRKIACNESQTSFYVGELLNQTGFFLDSFSHDRNIYPPHYRGKFSIEETDFYKAFYPPININVNTQLNQSSSVTVKNKIASNHDYEFLRKSIEELQKEDVDFKEFQKEVIGLLMLLDRVEEEPIGDVQKSLLQKTWEQLKDLKDAVAIANVPSSIHMLFPKIEKAITALLNQF